jgi:hypothetical protein
MFLVVHAFALGVLLLSAIHAWGLPLRNIIEQPALEQDNHLCTAEEFLQIDDAIRSNFSMLYYLMADGDLPEYPPRFDLATSFTAPIIAIQLNLSDGRSPIVSVEAQSNETALQAVNRVFAEQNLGTSSVEEEIQQKSKVLDSYLKAASRHHPSQPISLEFYRETPRPTRLVLNWGDCYSLADEWFPYIPLFEFNTRPIRYLEIGVHKGCNAKSVALTYALHKDSRIYCVDPWQDYKDFSQYRGRQAFLFSVFSANIQLLSKVHRNKFVVRRGFSSAEVVKFPDGYFDVIYVDGNHESPYALEDAVLSFRRLRIGGFIVLDDYDWASTRLGVDAFIAAYRQYITVIGASKSQIFLKKESDMT